MTINAALDRATGRVGILGKVTAHTAKHTYAPTGSPRRVPLTIKRLKPAWGRLLGG